ncbi:sigma-54 interaction domain-containing protein [Faecalispora jeddahensis]|uniref:sigma-54 interaction domain-containing protein n=1 Tax=Faecalispora jeddahensis TaxID=1414721 RepID=UPI0004ADD8CE|nr:sigma-54-dependent Fis family transcriptional regulator [Faecalispora jeddahensis]
MEKHKAITTKTIQNWDKEFLFDILENISDAVMINDADTTIVYVNHAYEVILGTPAEKAVGKRLRDIEPDAIAIKVIETGKPSHNIVDYLRTVNIHAVGMSFPIYKNDAVSGAVSIFNDVSEIDKLTKELQRTREINKYFQQELEKKHLPQSFSEYIYSNNNIKDMLFLASKVAKTDATVLIRGESGVGKEVLARAVYKESKRNKMPFIKVNCASIPENLLESELFGYEDGAFTGAKRGGKIGKFELAQGGTIFLDEIGDMAFSMQAKILRVLQEREIERVGGTKTIALDVRVIAATNKNLEEMIEQGTFRSDLYYRLNVVPLNISPLRERKDDIILLSRSLLERLNKNSEEKVSLSSDVIKVLQKYNWPGNIRELQNVLEHANIIRTGNQVEVKDLPKYIVPKEHKLDVKHLETFNLKSNIEMMEKELIRESLLRNHNNKSRAINELGISRRTFYEKLSKYGFE